MKLIITTIILLSASSSFCQRGADSIIHAAAAKFAKQVRDHAKADTNIRNISAYTVMISDMKEYEESGWSDKNVITVDTAGEIHFKCDSLTAIKILMASIIYDSEEQRRMYDRLYPPGKAIKPKKNR